MGHNYMLRMGSVGRGVMYSSGNLGGGTIRPGAGFAMGNSGQYFTALINSPADTWAAYLYLKKKKTGMVITYAVLQADFF